MRRSQNREVFANFRESLWVSNESAGGILHKTAYDGVFCKKQHMTPSFSNSRWMQMHPLAPPPCRRPCSYSASVTGIDRQPCISIRKNDRSICRHLRSSRCNLACQRCRSAAHSSTAMAVVSSSWMSPTASCRPPYDVRPCGSNRVDISLLSCL